MNELWDATSDVIVLGAGTGLYAAVSAALKGAKVLVLEKRDVVGGDLNLSGGVIYGGETALQAREGIIDDRTGLPDSKESLLADWMRHAGEYADVALVTKILDAANDALEFLTDLNIRWHLYQSGNDPVKRGHQTTTYAGDVIVDALVKEAKRLGVQILTNHTATQILARDGKVYGVEARVPDGNSRRLSTKAVILATGGAADNRSLITQYNPESLTWVNIGYTGSDGDGYGLAEKFHARVIGGMNWLDEQFPNHCLLGTIAGEAPTKVLDPFITDSEVIARTGPRPMIFLDSRGERFVDETAGYLGNVGVAIARLPEAYCWNVFDRRLWTVDDSIFRHMLGRYGCPGDDIEKTGIIKRSYTLAGLARKTGLPADALKRSVHEWNRMIAAGHDSRFGRPSNTLAMIAKPPYYAYRIVPASCAPQVGPNISLDVDSYCRVLDDRGAYTPGLFASGSGLLMHRTLGRGYPGSGANLTVGFGTGHIAGTEAALHALGVDHSTQ